MKLRSVDNVVDSNLDQTPEAFRIKTSVKAFQILSSQLYSDKIGAVVRELSTNAFDAHKLVSKGDEPFEVHLPTTLDPEFHVRDFGPGLTHEQVMTLYTTYFDSDKLHTNEMAGGLGLGSKTPFAYTDTFTVTSFQGGIMRIYSAFIKDGFPQIVPLSSSNTDEPDGLKVSMPVQRSDFQGFKSSAETQLRYFEPKPKMTGQKCEIKSVGYMFREKEFALRNDHNWYDKPIRIIMGPVGYPIDVNKAPPKLKVVLDELGYSSVDIFANIGDVDIAASREGLSYDEFSTKRIIKFLRDIDTIVGKYAQKYVEEAPSLWEAIRLHNMLKKNLKQKELTWHDKKIDTYMRVLTNFQVAHITHEAWRRKYLKLRFTAEMRFDPDHEKPTILYQDDPKIPLYRTLRYNEDALYSDYGEKLLVAKYGADLHSICDAIDKDGWVNMSDLDQPPKPVRIKAGRKKMEVGFAKIQFNNWGGWETGTEVNVGKFIQEANKPVVWVSRNGDYSEKKEHEVPTMIRNAEFLEWFGKERPHIMGILRSSKHIKKKLTIPHFEDWFLSEFKTYSDQFDLRLIVEWKRLFSTDRGSWAVIEELLPNEEWREYLLEKDASFAKIHKLFEMMPGKHFSGAFRFLDHYDQYVGKKIKPKTYYLQEALNRFRKRFELLFTLPRNHSPYPLEAMKPYLDKIR